MPISVIIPCLNEELSIGQTIKKIKSQNIPTTIIVVDNGSTDQTVAIALNSGAKVIHEPKKGKGFAIRRGLNSLPINTEVVFMIDGDDTYDVSKMKEAYELIINSGFDMVVGTRIVISGDKNRQSHFRFGHGLGNLILTKLYRYLFKIKISDTLSGWRMMSKGFVDSFSGGESEFEIEAELNAHAFTISAPVSEIPIFYSGRKIGSSSKLRTYRDGWAIMRRNLKLYKSERPMFAYNLLALPWLFFSIYSISVVLNDFFETGLVPRFPTLIAGVGCFIVAGNLWMTGMILERVRLQRVALARYAYLNANRN